MKRHGTEQTATNPEIIEATGLRERCCWTQTRVEDFTIVIHTTESLDMPTGHLNLLRLQLCQTIYVNHGESQFFILQVARTTYLTMLNTSDHHRIPLVLAVPWKYDLEGG